MTGINGIGTTAALQNIELDNDTDNTNVQQAQTDEGTGLVQGTEDDQQVMAATPEDMNKELEDEDEDGTEDNTANGTQAANGQRKTPEETQAAINKLQADIATAEADKAEQITKRDNANTAMTDLQGQLTEEEDAYNRLKDDIKGKNSDLEAIIAKIEAETENLEDEAVREQRHAAFLAMANYNPEEHGEDYDKYFKGEMDKVGMPDSASLGIIGTLQGKAGNLSDDIKTMFSQLSTKAKSIGDIRGQLTTQTNIYNTAVGKIKEDDETIQNANNQIANLIPNMVSEAEWSLVEDNNINIYEKLEDGSPRYIFAPGKEDGAYHIYDMSNGATLARQFGTEGGLRGSDVVPCGNGYINGFQSAGECDCEAETVYYMDSCCQMNSMKATYSTSSPLSLDLNGDGVTTSDRMIDYDIDGDGTLDRINDSNDAVLVFDKDHDGIAGEDGSECFGENTDLDGDGKADGYKNGFEALAALARKEGLVNDNDDMTLDSDDLSKLSDKYGLSIKTGGYNSEAQSLDSVGITEINISNADTVRTDNFDGKHNDIMTQAGATFKINGEERTYADLWHRDYNDAPTYEEVETAEESYEFKEAPKFDELDSNSNFFLETSSRLSESENKFKRTVNKFMQ